MIISVLTMIKNESRRLREWLYFHKKVHDIDRFVFYLDSPNDDSKQVLDSLKEQYNIECFTTREDNPYRYEYWGGRQTDSFTRGSIYLKDKTDWIAIFDVDEFIVPNENKKMKDVLSNLDKRLYIPTFCFRPPFDPSKSIREQCLYRWSAEERKVRGHGGSGKSVFRTDQYCNTMVHVHYGPYPENLIPEIESSDLKLQHYRIQTSNGIDNYNIFDDSILKYFPPKNEAI